MAEIVPFNRTPTDGRLPLDPLLLAIVQAIRAITVEDVTPTQDQSTDDIEDLAA